SDSFTYTVNDNNGVTSNTATVNITITPQNDPPTAADDSNSGTEDNPVSVNVTSNDLDTDGTIDPATVDLNPTLANRQTTYSSTNGEWSVNNSGMVTFTPNANWNGTESITYVVADNNGLFSNQATIEITITAVNDAPTAFNDSNSGLEDNPVSVNVTSNDSDIDGTINIASVDLNPSLANRQTTYSSTNGEWTVDNSGIVTFTPNTNWNGTESITYVVADNGGLFSNQATIQITISADNDGPVFTSSPVTTATEDALYTYNITATDVDGQPINFAITTNPGWLSLDDNGDGTATLSGTPINDYVGNNGVVISVSDGTANTTQAFTINVVNTNDAPVFTSTATTAANEDELYTYNVVTNDVDGQTPSITLTTNPGWLSLDDNGDGTATLSGTPTNDHVGNNSVTLTASDGITSTEQNFTISVSNVNDSPVFTSNPPTSATEDAPYSYDVIATDVDLGETPSFTLTTNPGWLTINDNGDGTATLTGTPTNEYVGNNNVTITASDGTANVQQPFIINVINTNDAPVFTAFNPPATIAQGTLYDYTITTSDDDGDIPDLSMQQGPAWLNFVDENDGTATLFGTPSNSDVGSYTIIIRADDGTTTTDESFDITVTNVNDDPEFTSTAILSVNEDEEYNYPIIVTDPDSDAITLTAPTKPDWLTFTDNTDGTGSLIGTPTNANVGTHNVILIAEDPNGGGDIQNFNITVVNVNDAPVISNISRSTPENVAITITLSGFASDDDNNLDISSLIVVDQPVSGSVSINATSGDVTYTPNAGFAGNDSFTLQISDTDGATSNVGSVQIQVSNEAPNAVDDAFTIDEDTPSNFTILANDTDPQNNIDPSSVTIITQVSNGTLTVNANGTVDYTPNSNYNGSDAFAYEVSDTDGYTDQASVNITITAVNDAPNLAADSYTINEDTPIDMNVLGNDSDVENSVEPSSIQIEASATNGTVTINGDYTIRYEPNLNFNGSDSFSYSAADADGLRSQANVEITITPANDAPVFTSSPLEEATQDAPYNYSITTNDVDGDTPTIDAVFSASWLSFTDNGNGTATLSGTPTNDDINVYPIEITVSDGTLSNTQSFSISVNNANDAPVFTSTPVESATEDTPYTYNVSASDIDVGEIPVFTMESGPTWLTLTDNTDGTAVLTGTPLNEHVGTHNVTLRAADAATYAEQTFTVTVTNTNDAPVFTSSPIITIDEDTEYDYSITCSDDDGNAISIQGVVIPTWLTFTDNGNGSASLTGTPTNSQVGQHAVSLSVSDGTATTSQNFTIEVVNVNDAPVLSDANYSTPENTPVSILFVDISEDVDGNIDATSLRVVQQPNDGSVSIDPSSGNMTYTPEDGFSGTDRFTVRVNDTDGANSNIASIEILVSNEAPNAVNDSYTTDEDTPVVCDVLENDIDPQDNILANTLSITNQPTKGVVSVNGSNGTITYTPNANENGADSFTYEVCDADGYCDQATVSMNINPVNDPPVINGDSYVLNEDQSMDLPILDNDTDIDSEINPASLAITSDATNGTLTINSNSITYTPNQDYNGNDSFSYSVADEQGLSGEATVNLTINPVNDRPIAMDDEGETSDVASIVINVAANDIDVDNNLNLASIMITRAPDHGTATVNGSTGNVTYIPDLNYYGADTYQYQICDTDGECSTATVRLTVRTGNAQPIADPIYKVVGEDGVLTNIRPLESVIDPNGNLDNGSLTIEVEPQHGEVTLQNEIVTYKPFENYYGNDTIVYSICDLGEPPLCDQDTIFIRVLSVNDAPVASDYILEATEGTPASVNLAELGTDIEMDELTIALPDDLPGIPGILSIIDETTLEFTANIGSLCSTFNVDYILLDSNGGKDTAEVVIKVLPIDSDGDNIPDATENSELNNLDSDNDGIPDYLDEDSDNDGITDLIEGNINDLCNDVPQDTDNDGTPDYLDEDSDNDLVSDLDEGYDDCDNDGIPNAIDSFDNCTSRALNIPEVFVPGSSVKEQQHFTIKGAEALVGDELFVFNRWGGQVYYSADYDNTWRGLSSSSMLGSEELPEGTYFYVYKTKEGQVIKGTVYIKR
ncbi:tandem-95 repeat protein, partial [Carboxylicivirga sediminis]